MFLFTFVGSLKFIPCLPFLLMNECASIIFLLYSSTFETSLRCVSWHVILYCTVLYCTVLYCTVLYCTVLYCTALYCTVLYCTALYCTVLQSIARHVALALHASRLTELCLATNFFCTPLHFTALNVRTIKVLLHGHMPPTGRGKSLP